MRKDICCPRCSEVIANDDGEQIIPVKKTQGRTRYHYKESLLTVLCHECNFLSYFKGNQPIEDSEKRNAKFALDKQNKKPINHAYSSKHFTTK